MNLILFFSIIIIHWYADFVCQTDWQARNKSKEWKPLLYHTITYTLVWYINLVGFSLYQLYHPKFMENVLGWDYRILFFPLITFVFHTITDYYTSRLNGMLWMEVERYRNLKLTDTNNQDYYEKQIGRCTHNFFVAIGFDQVLHYLQLFLTYYLLTK